MKDEYSKQVGDVTFSLHGDDGLTIKKNSLTIRLSDADLEALNEWITAVGEQILSETRDILRRAGR